MFRQPPCASSFIVVLLLCHHKGQNVELCLSPSGIVVTVTVYQTHAGMLLDINDMQYHEYCESDQMNATCRRNVGNWPRKK